MNLACNRQYPDPGRPATSETLSLIQVGRELGLPFDRLTVPISERYPRIRVSIANPVGDLAEAYDTRRNQYHSTRILALLENHIQSVPADKLLGVTALDLFVPGMNFVFGEARLPGRVGVVSTIRLKPQSPVDDGLFEARVVKEAVHEVGHMLGLSHCPKASCVMHFSERLADTDLKSANLCETCQSQLRRSR